MRRWAVQTSALRPMFDLASRLGGSVGQHVTRLAGQKGLVHVENSGMLIAVLPNSQAKRPQRAESCQFPWGVVFLILGAFETLKINLFRALEGLISCFITFLNTLTDHSTKLQS